MANQQRCNGAVGPNKLKHVATKKSPWGLEKTKSALKTWVEELGLALKTILNAEGLFTSRLGASVGSLVAVQEEWPTLPFILKVPIVQMEMESCQPHLVV
jgi:hypothetical protein